MCTNWTTNRNITFLDKKSSSNRRACSSGHCKSMLHRKLQSTPENRTATSPTTETTTMEQTKMALVDEDLPVEQVSRKEDEHHRNNRVTQWRSHPFISQADPGMTRITSQQTRWWKLKNHLSLRKHDIVLLKTKMRACEWNQQNFSQIWIILLHF